MCLLAGDLTACACTKKYLSTFFALVVLGKVEELWVNLSQVLFPPEQEVYEQEFINFIKDLYSSFMVSLDCM